MWSFGLFSTMLEMNTTPLALPLTNTGNTGIVYLGTHFYFAFLVHYIDELIMKIQSKSDSRSWMKESS